MKYSKILFELIIHPNKLCIVVGPPVLHLLREGVHKFHITSFNFWNVTYIFIRQLHLMLELVITQG